MGRKRKLLLGNHPIGGKPLKSRRLARIVTSKYHKIRNEIEKLSNSTLPAAQKKQQQIKLADELEQLGGIEAYQQASVVSTQHFKTSRWIVKVLCILKEDLMSNSTSKIRTLEVGAINTQLINCPKLCVRAIDVHSVNSKIEECDFFTIEPKHDYEVVVCSMVINCVTDCMKRVEMIARLTEHLSMSGVLFIILPIRCVDSKFVGSSRFEELLSGFGLTQLREKRTTPRLVFYTLGRTTQCMDFVECATMTSDATQSTWVSSVRAIVTQRMSKSVIEYFSRDCSGIPATDFALQIPTNLLSNHHQLG